MKYLATATVLLFFADARGQNLVLNGSFEEYEQCPWGYGQFGWVVGWSGAYNTPDYFNACAGGIICGVPFNHVGYQVPADGDAYVGLGTYKYNDPDYREIISSELVSPLQIGVSVHVSLKASCGGYGSVFWNSAKWKARGPGLKFFVDLPSDWSAYLYPNNAAVYMDTVLSDTTANWVTVSGTFVPDSAYRYIAITNFFEDSLSWPTIQDSVYGILSGAYALIDDVCVSPTPGGCDGTPLVQADGGTTPQFQVTGLPDGRISLTLAGSWQQPIELSIHDMTGRCIDDHVLTLSNGQVVLPPSTNAHGVCVARITDAHGRTAARTFVQP